MTPTTITTDLTKTQLAAVLAALDDRPRNPANRDAALRAIARSAERLGLTTAEVLAAAPGLLDGRLGADEWRAELRDQADPTVALDRAHRAAVVPDEAPEDGGDWPDAEAAGDDAETPEPATVVAAAPDIEAPAAAAPEPAPASDAAAAAASEPAAKPTPRTGTKQALLIDLLRRPEGATIAQIAAATGWQHHTIRGAISGALKKKLGLTIEATRTREVGPNRTGVRGSGTVYRIVAPA